MGLKVHCNEIAKQQPKPYPKLVKMNWPETQGLIVLKTSKSTGTVIIPGKSNYQTGTYYSMWAYSNDEDYNNTISIQNE